jgi:hypothetical protein
MRVGRSHFRISKHSNPLWLVDRRGAEVYIDFAWWRRRCGKPPEDSGIRKALEDSLALEISVSVIRTANALGFQTESALIGRFPELCQAIKSKRATIEQDRRSKIASVLRAAIREVPPPALEEVASRLGYASEGSLKAHQAKLCERLFALRRQIAERSKKMLGDRLRAMLKEKLPPTSIPAASGCTISSAFQSTFFWTEPFCLPVGFFFFIILLLQSGIVDSARFRFVNKKFTNGVRSAAANDNGPPNQSGDRMKTGATLSSGYGTPV